VLTALAPLLRGLRLPPAEPRRGCRINFSYNLARGGPERAWLKLEG
jgi:hypothetical protein